MLLMAADVSWQLQPYFVRYTLIQSEVLPSLVAALLTPIIIHPIYFQLPLLASRNHCVSILAQFICVLIQCQSAPRSVVLERQQFVQRCDCMDGQGAVTFDFSLEMTLHLSQHGVWLESPQAHLWNTLFSSDQSKMLKAFSDARPS